MASHSSGADVFLVKPDGKYLGCTCPWKNCGPGYRASCDAEHCGLRPYLHDDLGLIRLTPEVIAQPPVMLWPEPHLLAACAGRRSRTVNRTLVTGCRLLTKSVTVNECELTLGR